MSENEIEITNLDDQTILTQEDSDVEVDKVSLQETSSELEEGEEVEHDDEDDEEEGSLFPSFTITWSKDISSEGWLALVVTLVGICMALMVTVSQLKRRNHSIDREYQKRNHELQIEIAYVRTKSELAENAEKNILAKFKGLENVLMDCTQELQKVNNQYKDTTDMVSMLREENTKYQSDIKACQEHTHTHTDLQKDYDLRIESKTQLINSLQEQQDKLKQELKEKDDMLEEANFQFMNKDRVIESQKRIAEDLKKRILDFMERKSADMNVIKSELREKTKMIEDLKLENSKIRSGDIEFEDTLVEFEGNAEQGLLEKEINLTEET